MITSKDSFVRYLVGLYANWKAWEESEQAYEKTATSMSIGYHEGVRERREIFSSELKRYSRKYYRSDDKSALARSMDDVLITFNQLTLFKEV